MSVRLDRVSFSYDGMATLEQVSLTAHPGEVLALIGPNGAGKTTLLHLISGVLHPDEGEVFVCETPVKQLSSRALARRLAALEQERQVAFDFSVEEVVSWGRFPHQNRWHRLNDADRQAIERALKVTGISEMGQRPVQTLSGGQRQRVFLAMALAQEPEILVLDEPTAHLDLKYQLDVLALTRRLARRGLTVILALHDLNLAARFADRVAVLSQGRLVASGRPQDVLTEARIAEVWEVSVEVVAHPIPFILPR